MIISVHTPKAAGTSLSASFVDSYGKERVLLDYTDDPADVRSQFHLDPDYVRCRRIDAPQGVDVVHGHFHPSRYAHVADAQFVTFLRHPVENLISIYRYWRTLPRTGNPLHEYFLDQNLGILEAARLPLLRYLISRTYFGGFDMDRFSFIGTMEHYSADVRRLSKIIGRPLPEMRQNVTAEVGEAGAAGGDSDLTSGGKTVAALWELLRDDIAFYERAVALPAAQRGD